MATQQHDSICQAMIDAATRQETSMNEVSNRRFHDAVDDKFDGHCLL